MERATSSKYASTPESGNFAKLTRLFVDLLRDVLWETLTKRLLPEELPNKVRINKEKLETAGMMREDQYRRICRPEGRVSNEDFDITLLYMLLRNLPMEEKKIQRPSKGWGCDAYPDKKHLNEGDDIERIRLRRNQVFGQVGKASLSKDAFDQIWADMLAVVKRFDIRLKTNFESEMEVILKDKLPSELAENYMRDFEREIAMDAKEGAAKVKKLVEKNLEETENIKCKLAETDRKVDDLTKDVKEKKKDAGREPNETLKIMLEKTRGKLEELKPEREYFYPTKDFNQAKDFLLNKNRGYTVFLSGNPGEGKTTVGHMLLLEMQKKGKTCLILNEPADAKYVTPEHVDIIMVDNIFGTVTYEDYLSGLWKRHFDEFKKWKKEKVCFVFTSRELIYRECKRFLDKEDFFDKDGLILLSSEKLKQEEKTEILLKQLVKNKESKEASTLSIEEVTKCCSGFTSPYGFPLCCQVFASDIVYLRQKSNFFTRPLEALEAGIKELWKNDANKPMFVALAAVWKSNYMVEELDLGLHAQKVLLRGRLSLSNFGKEKVEDVAKSLNILLSHTFSMDELFEKLNGVYLTHHKPTSWQSGGYTFSHEVIEEAFGRVLIEIKPDAAIQYGSMEFLVNNTCTVKRNNEDKEMSSMDYWESLKIPIEKQYYNDLFQRLMVSLRDLDDEFVAVHHSAFEDSNFLDFFFEKFKETGIQELKELMTRRRGFAWGFTKTSFLKEALEQNTPKIELVRRILEKRLLDQIDDKRWVQEQKQSMFSAACRRGLFQLYELLIQEGVAVTSDAFIRATIAGNKEIIEDLFRRADIDQERSIYDKCLALAFQGGFLDLVKLFIKKGANLDMLSPPNKETPLYQAISHKLEDTSLFLMDEGADADAERKPDEALKYMLDLHDEEEFLQAIRNNDQKVEEMIRNKKIPKQSIMKVAVKQDGYSMGVQLALREMSKLLCEICQAVGVWCGYRPEDPQTPVFVVTLKNQKCIMKKDEIQEPFRDYKIIIQHKHVPNDEERSVVEHYGSKSIRSEDIARVNNCIATHTENLMSEHSKLSIIRPCPVKACGYLRKEMKVIEDTCIVFYVPAKGIIPVGEKEFPRVIDGIVTDVREGEFLFFGAHNAMEYHPKLRIGCCITGDKIGSLGGFVDLPGDKVGCLTAAHVVLTNNQIQQYINMGEEEKRRLNEDFEQGKENIEIHQPTPKPGLKPFGRVQAIALDAGTIFSPSVDAAIIQITDDERKPEMGSFPGGDFENVGFTMEEPMLYTSGDILEDIEPYQNGSLVIKFGCTTGITRGYMEWIGESVRLVDAWGNYCFPVMMGQMEVNMHNFAEQGDSGALVFLCLGGNIRNLHAVGMIMGGSSTGCSCFITPIKPVLAKLGIINNRFKVFPPRQLSQQNTISQPLNERISMTEHLTRIEQNMNESMNERFMRVEENMNEHLTTIEQNIKRVEENMNENMKLGFNRIENLLKTLSGNP